MSIRERELLADIDALKGVADEYMFDAECRKDLLKLYKAEISSLRLERDELLRALTATRGQWIHSVNALLCLSAIDRCEKATT